nr:RNA-directed DNA polymerase, eukaryota [Tanacetum cinerariifolium]
LCINIHKSQLWGVGVSYQVVQQAAYSIGCSIVQNQFRYLGVTIGDRMTRIKAWENIDAHKIHTSSNWCAIVRELHSLKDKGFDFWSHCKKRIGNGLDTSFWYDCWIDDSALHIKFPRLFALELDKDISVAGKMNSQVTQSFRREPRGGIELQRLTDLATLLDSVVLNNSKDRWYCDLSGDGEFRVKELRNFIDDKYLPSRTEATRWVKLVPIKVNIFVWRARRDCLPTRTNLEHRGVDLLSVLRCLVVYLEI